MQKNLLVLMFSVAFSLLAANGHTQDFRIFNYGVLEGVCHPFVYTIVQDNGGFIWLGTGNGLCKFDGFIFQPVQIPDSLSGKLIETGFRDSNGYMWFGSNSGELFYFTDEGLKLVSSDTEISGSITGFTEIDNKTLAVSTMNQGIFTVNSETGAAIKLSGINEGLFTCVYFENNLLISGSQTGLYIYDMDANANMANLNNRVNELEYIRVQDIKKSSLGEFYWIATEDAGLFQLELSENNYNLIPVKGDEIFTDGNIQSVVEDSDGRIWISTLLKGLYMANTFNLENGLSGVINFSREYNLNGNAVKSVSQDKSGNIWMASYGQGISLFTEQPFKINQYDTGGLDNDIRAIYYNVNDVLFIGSKNGLFKSENTNNTGVVRINSIPVGEVVAMQAIEGKLLVGMKENGVYLLNIANGSAVKINYAEHSLGNSVNSIAYRTESVYIGTNDGIYRLNEDLELTGHYTTMSGLPHNSIQHIYIDNLGQVLFATRTNGICKLSEDGIHTNIYPVRDAEVEFMSITQDANNNIWAATLGNGVFHFRGDTVYNFTEAMGMKSNYCYSLVAGNGDEVWVGHRLGMSRININDHKIGIYDLNIGITGDFNPNSVYKNPAGNILWGTTEGLLIYDPAGDDMGSIPPDNHITRLLISDREYDFSEDIVLPYGTYKLRIEFIGLDYGDPQSVKYQYKLDGYDLEWSDITNQKYAGYPRIEDGEYKFYLRSYNNKGLTVETPLSLSIRVKPPFWKRWWFLTGTGLIIILGFYLIIKIRERKQKELQEYLEKELEARTREVVEQKEVIELKNRDITDSITYAKRIQTSMLPPVKRMQQHFTGCFVFYSPRDIVSGDFYWFDKVNENKFVVVCADSTGHGVPGAFMSMIGSTLIKDICSRDIENSPSQILQALDSELEKTLNRNLEDGTKPSDGMDLVVCEVDLNSFYVRFASAMRPIIFYKNNEEIFIKGSRNSIGGIYEKENNIFEDSGIQLSKGDIIYMFSDGYSDQFGGPMGKKFKMVRLKNMLEEINQKPMDEQYQIISSSFNEWKADYEQVDDVLFMGIKM